MDKELKIHLAQVQILRALIFKPEARFVELNKSNLSSDLFSFHIKSLIEAGLLVKNINNSYSLSAAGKEFANRFDMDSEKVSIEKQAKLGVLLCCIKRESSQTRYLLQQRLKQPYFGFHGFITGKVKWGETVFETASRELEEETGLSGDLTLVGVKHKMDYSQEQQLLEDKYFFVFRAERLKGELIESFEGGKNIWLSQKEILVLPNLFDGVEETIEMVSQDKVVFSESKYTVKGY